MIAFEQGKYFSHIPGLGVWPIRLDGIRMSLTGTSKLDRRNVMKVGGAVAAGTIAGKVSITMAQTPEASPEASPEATPGGYPTVIESSVEGVPNAYTAYPEPFKTVEETPGDGSTVRMTTLSYNPPVLEKSENTYWQELEARLGITYEPDLVPADVYSERLATIIAGGDLPDLLFLLPDPTRPLIYDSISQGAFLDLTEIVESGKIKEYNNLALIPDYMWDATRFEGKIWGVPKPVLRNNDVITWRQDWGTTLGTSTLESGDDLARYLIGVSNDDPDGNGNARDTWGWVPPLGGWHKFILNQVHRVPHTWHLNDDGSLVAAHETEEFKAALEYGANLFQEGAYHPDSAAIDVALSVEMMNAGQVGMAANGYAAVFGNSGFRTKIKEIVPDADLQPLLVPGVDGGLGSTYPISGIYGFVSMPGAIAGDEARIDTLLKVLNYFHAPFGSEESTFLRYGIEGEHSQRTEDGGYQMTPEGSSMRGAMAYAFLSENYFYYPGRPEEAVLAQKHNERMAAQAVENPAMGLFAPAEGEYGSVLNQLINDTYGEIITGRSGIERLDEMRTQWKDRGGDEIRAQLEEALRG